MYVVVSPRSGIRYSFTPAGGVVPPSLTALPPKQPLDKPTDIEKPVRCDRISHVFRAPLLQGQSCELACR